MYTPELIITVLENAVFYESVERNRSAHRSTTNQQIVARLAMEQPFVRPTG